MKKFIAFLLILLIFPCGLSKTDSADAGTNYQVTCPSGTRHEMHLSGNADCYSGTAANPGSKIFGGYFSECSLCGLYMISDGFPNNTTQYIGRVACSYSINFSLMGYVIMYSSVIGTYSSPVSDPFIQGFHFVF